MTVLRSSSLYLLTRGGHGFHLGEWYRKPCAVIFIRGVGLPREFHAFPVSYFRILFILPRLLAILNLSYFISWPCHRQPV